MKFVLARSRYVTKEITARSPALEPPAGIVHLKAGVWLTHPRLRNARLQRKTIRDWIVLEPGWRLCSKELGTVSQEARRLS